MLGKKRKDRVAATELADMVYCERRLQLRQKHGPRSTKLEEVAKARGHRIHKMAEFTAPRGPLGTRPKAGCFIATAVYGEFAEETQILRLFRDQVLRRYQLGRCATQVYYRYSPAIAMLIGERKGRRLLAGALLSPLVGICKVIYFRYLRNRRKVNGKDRSQS